MSRLRIGDRDVGKGRSPYVIAGVVVPDGTEDAALEELAVATRDVGADALKLRPVPHAGSDLARAVGPSVATLQRLQGLCERIGIHLLCSAATHEMVDRLEEAGVVAHRIGSRELHDGALLQHVGETRKPVLISTGMATLADVERALDELRDAGADQIVLLQAVSLYPPPIEDVNLRAMDTLGHAFGLPVGYSDHTPGNSVALAAAARGACVLEKHFALAPESAPDRLIAASPIQLRQLVREIRLVTTALGSPLKRPARAEWDLRRRIRSRATRRADRRVTPPRTSEPAPVEKADAAVHEEVGPFLRRKARAGPAEGPGGRRS